MAVTSDPTDPDSDSRPVGDQSEQADTDEPKSDEVEEWEEESFPSSDPPANY